MAERINKWYYSAKRLLFRYKDGFFELPIMANSPETIIKSLAKMPFVRHSPSKRWFGSNNPFNNADIFYYKIEKGLWFMHSDAFYKENVMYKRFNDKQLPSDYYLLFLEVTRSKDKSKNGLINGISYSSCTWVLLKPNAGNTHCRFKGSSTSSLVLYISKRWLNEVLLKHSIFLNSSLQKFFESKAKLLMFQEDIKFAEQLEKESKKIFASTIEHGGSNTSIWLDFSFSLISRFVEVYSTKNMGDNLFEISQINRKTIIQAEKYLIDNMAGPFIGIERLSQMLGISGTKLKRNFKLVYGDTIFQYFRKKQLESAKIMLKNSDMSIKDIAAVYGYNSPSKFTAAYKTYFRELPSSRQWSQ